MTRRGQKGGAEEEDRAGNMHEKVRPLRRKGRQEQTRSGRKTSGGREREREKSQREGPGWGLWLPLLTAIDFL